MKLLIIGAGGHGKVAADIAAQSGYEDIAFLEDNKNIKACMGYPVIGTSDMETCPLGCVFFVAIGNAHIRESLQKRMMKRGLKAVTLIHPKAVLAAGTRIGEGSILMAGTVINPGTVIGRGCIINTGATVDHDNFLGDYTHISVGAHLAGEVKIGDKTWIGAGAVVINNVNVCGGCTVGAGAVVVRDIDVQGTYLGVPARLKA